MTLHPQSVAALELWSQGPSVSDPGFGADGIAAMRRDALAAAAREEKEPVGRVEDVDADGVRCRLYKPAGVPETVQRAVLFLHGGGFVFGDVDTHDGQARRIANRTGSAVLAVDYRRPPEHRFPAAPDDVDTALRWLVAALRNPGLLAATVLVYPFVDATASMPSYARTDGGLTRAQGEWFLRQYIRDERDLVDPDLTPILATGFATLPPTYVQVAEHDALADEDLELARRIAAAGATVETTVYDGMIHGFWRNPQLFDAAELSLGDAAAFLDRHV